MEAKKPKQQQKLKSKTSRNKNLEFSVITYIFLLLFICLMGYFVYFQVVKSEKFINSPYNSLQDLFSKNVVRGEIRSEDGYVLAKTDVAADGTETRNYPYSNVFAHAVGYSVNGKAGLENQMNFSLLRSHEFFLEQIVNDLRDQKNIGDNLVTTLNYTLQQTAYDALGSYDGAVIVMEPETGRILAMVSKPDYDPNTIAENWESVSGDGSTALFNRATQGSYAPGSTFKILTTLEYYKENPDTYMNYSFDCDGEFTDSGKTIHCAGNEAHGEEDLMASFANSCNSSYANIALTLDLDQYQDLCNSLLFNRQLPIAFESSVSSFSLSSSDPRSQIMETGIGQGNTLVSPLHMCMIASTICNNGTLMNPYLVDHTESYKGVTVDTYSPKEYGTLLSSDEASFMQSYMQEAAASGTAGKLAGQSYTAYGKTGTAQVSDTSDQTNAWFVGYAHKDGQKDIAIAVVVEDSGYGVRYAVPIAQQVFAAYFQ